MRHRFYSMRPYDGTKQTPHNPLDNWAYSELTRARDRADTATTALCLRGLCSRPLSAYIPRAVALGRYIV